LIDVQRAHRQWVLDRAEIAYWVDPDRQGAGIATEAARAVIACAFGQLGLNRLRISHASSNPASGRIPQKLGFRFVGTERQFFMKDGVWHDMNHYELLAKDWAMTQGDPS
jgi:ribosomal-protein-serine acetyltransferase